MMGLFFGILGADPAVPIGPGGRVIPTAPLSTQVRIAWRALGEKAVWYCKSFSVITALFSGCDCLFEKAPIVSIKNFPLIFDLLHRREGNTTSLMEVSLAVPPALYLRPNRARRLPESAAQDLPPLVLPLMLSCTRQTDTFKTGSRAVAGSDGG